MGEPTSNVLEYYPTRPRDGSSASAWFVFVLPVFAAIAAAQLFGGAWGLPSGVLVAGLIWYRRRRANSVPQAIIRVDGGVLIVTNADRKEILRVAVGDLEEVTLDTKTIQKVQENMASGVPDLRFIDSRVGPGIDNSRIALVTAEAEVLLTEYYTSSFDATEWFSKIRRFLRRNGWQPMDERVPELAEPYRSPPPVPE